MSKDFLTVAGRWRQHVAGSNLEKLVPEHIQTLAMLMFYAGFAASLDATMEAAELPEPEAMRVLDSLHTEVDQLAAMATRAMAGGGLS